jgi:hypothetical protein
MVVIKPPLLLLMLILTLVILDSSAGGIEALSILVSTLPANILTPICNLDQAELQLL